MFYISLWRLLIERLPSTDHFFFVYSMLAPTIWVFFTRLILSPFSAVRTFDDLMFTLPTYYKNIENNSVFVLG
jgi:hypothetical protein